MIGLIATPAVFRALVTACCDHRRHSASGPTTSRRTLESTRTRRRGLVLATRQGHDLVSRQSGQTPSVAVPLDVLQPVIDPAPLRTHSHSAVFDLELHFGARVETELVADLDRNCDLTLGSDLRHGLTGKDVSAIPRRGPCRRGPTGRRGRAPRLAPRPAQGRARARARE